MRTNEEWRPCSVAGYEVSNLGRVRETATGRFVTQSDTGAGYLRVWLQKKHHRVHVLVLEAWEPRPSPQHIPNHLDLNKSNNRLENLAWATIRENTIHAVREGAYHPHRKLNKYLAWVIRLRWALGDCHNVIARDYQVHPRTVRDITAGRTWVGC